MLLRHWRVFPCLNCYMVGGAVMHLFLFKMVYLEKVTHIQVLICLFKTLVLISLIGYTYLDFSVVVFHHLSSPSLVRCVCSLSSCSHLTCKERTVILKLSIVIGGPILFAKPFLLDGLFQWTGKKYIYIYNGSFT